MFILLIIIVLLGVSFVLAWRSLGELEAPQGVYSLIKKKVSKWTTILFLKERQIVYKSSTFSQDKKVLDKSKEDDDQSRE